MHAILKLLGLVEDEYHHIVAQFNSAVASLEKLAERKREEVSKAADAIIRHQEALDAAKTAEQQAKATAAKLRDLVS